MKQNNDKKGDAVIIACSAVLAAVFFCALFFAQPPQVGATGSVPGAGIGVSDGDRDNDGVIEGPADSSAGNIGDSISRGLEEIKDGAESLASDMIGDGTERTDRETVGKGEENGGADDKSANAEREPANTVWVVAAVIAAVAAVTAIAVAVPKRNTKKED